VSQSVTYLLRTREHLLEEVHGAVLEWRQVQLPFNAKEVEHVQLALHGTRELPSAYLHRLLSSWQMLEVVLLALMRLFILLHPFLTIIALYQVKLLLLHMLLILLHPPR